MGDRAGSIPVIRMEKVLIRSTFLLYRNFHPGIFQREELTTMCRLFIEEGKETWQSFKAYWGQERVLRWFAAIIIVLFYGTRLVWGDIFIDSDIMLTAPDELLESWYGHQRAGLIFTKKLFSLGRLLPYQQNVMFALTLWGLTLAVCFCFHEWSYGASWFRKGAFLFTGIFLTAPIFAEQFHFLLQAFEIGAAMFFCISASYCAGRWIYDKKSILWAVSAMVLMAWAFSSYQAFPAFYIALVLISYILVFLHGHEPCGLKEGIFHILLFLAGFAASQFCSRLFCDLHGASPSYVNSMFLWNAEPIETCIANIQEDIRRIYFGAWPVFFSRWFRYIAATASCLTLFYGFIRKSKQFPCLLLAVGILPVTPVLITLMTAFTQPIRGQMTYPLVYAFYLLLLYACFSMAPWKNAFIKYAGKTASMFILMGGMVLGWRQGIAMSHLWETAHEAYVSDVLTANRMYGDICHAADREQMDNCTVVFVGTRKVPTAGSPMVGDVIGHSFFEWDSDSSIGVSLRVNTFFETLGLNMAVPSEADYQSALMMCTGKPDWPAAGSVFLLDENTVVVKLSDP